MDEHTELLDKSMLDNIELNSKTLESTVDDVIRSYSDELDDYMSWVLDLLRDDTRPPTDAELDDMALRLSSLIYFTSVGTEQMGIRDDLSRAAYKEAYNVARSAILKGTVADKNMQAEIDAQAEHVVHLVYSKAYKILKAKVESAQEVLASIKKVMSRRQSEYETTRMGAYK